MQMILFNAEVCGPQFWYAHFYQLYLIKHNV